MSFEDEINRLKEEIKRAEREITDLVGAQTAKLSDLEQKFESVGDQDQLWAVFNELKNLKHQIKGEASRARHNLKHSIHEARDKVRAGEFEGASGEYAEEMYERLEELGDYLGDKLDEIGDSFVERADEVSERVREKIRNLRHAGRTSGFHVEVPYNVQVPTVTVPEIKIPDFGKVFSESISKAWTGVPSAIVSSVRLPQADLGLIDTLANAGIFKSRNEGIAFFAHRGIEASGDWLNKVKEKLADIKKLQEETKREIEKVTGVSTTTTTTTTTPPTPSPAPSPTPKSDEEEQGEREGEAQ